MATQTAIQQIINRPEQEVQIHKIYQEQLVDFSSTKDFCECHVISNVAKNQIVNLTFFENFINYYYMSKCQPSHKMQQFELGFNTLISYIPLNDEILQRKIYYFANSQLRKIKYFKAMKNNGTEIDSKVLGYVMKEKHGPGSTRVETIGKFLDILKPGPVMMEILGPVQFNSLIPKIFNYKLDVPDYLIDVMISANNIEGINMLVPYGAKITTKHLNNACKKFHIGIINRFFDLGVSPDENTIKSFKIENLGSVQNNLLSPKIFNSLIPKIFNYKLDVPDYLIDALILANNIEGVNMLVHYGAKITTKHLNNACKKFHIEIINRFLDLGVSPDENTIKSFKNVDKYVPTFASMCGSRNNYIRYYKKTYSVQNEKNILKFTEEKMKPIITKIVKNGYKITHADIYNLLDKGITFFELYRMVDKLDAKIYVALWKHGKNKLLVPNCKPTLDVWHQIIKNGHAKHVATFKKFMIQSGLQPTQQTLKLVCERGYDGIINYLLDNYDLVVDLECLKVMITFKGSKTLKNMMTNYEKNEKNKKNRQNNKDKEDANTQKK
jgi:hypothetical protein